MERIPIALVLVALTLFGGFTTNSGLTRPNRHAQPNASTQGETKTDGEGEALPKGALARLGSSQWRHGSWVVRSALSADGKRLATASTGSVAVWDVATGNVLFRFPTLSTKVRAEGFGSYYGPKILAFSPDGRKLGIAFNDEFTGVWDLENGGKFRRFTGKDISNSQGLCQFTRDGKLFILLHDDCIRFWDPVSGNLDRQIPASFAVSEISADASMYVQIDHDRNIAFNIRDFKTGATIKEFAIRAGEGDVVFAPDSKTLVVTDELKKEIQIWDAPPTQLRCTFALPQFAGVTQEGWVYPYCIHFTADSKVLMLATTKGQIHRWDLAPKKELPRLTSYAGEFVGLHDLPDSKTLIAVRSDGLIHRFDTTKNRETSDTGRYEGTPAIAVSPGGDLAAVGDSRGRLDLWELRPLKLRSTFRNDGPRVISVAFAADGKTLAVGLASETVSFHDVASGRQIRTISPKEANQKDIVIPFSTLLLSPDGQFLYFTNSANELLMWDVVNGKACWRWKDASSWGKPAVALSPDGKTLAFAPEGSEVLLLDALSGKKRIAVKLAVKGNTGFEELVGYLAFSADGNSLAATLGDGTIAVLDGATAKERKRLGTEGLGATSLAFSSDGGMLAAGVMESVWIWDTDTGKIVSRLEGHTDSVTSLGFGLDGRTILSSGADSQAYFWAFETKSRPQGN